MAEYVLLDALIQDEDSDQFTDRTYQMVINLDEIAIISQTEEGWTVIALNSMGGRIAVKNDFMDIVRNLPAVYSPNVIVR